jgi:phospholipase C
MKIDQRLKTLPYTKLSGLGWRVICGLGLAVMFCALTAPAFAQANADKSDASAPKTPPGISQIQHIVFLIKENRSFDNYFGTYPGAYGATSGPISNGTIVPLSHQSGATLSDPGHQYFDAINSIDNGKMDAFDLLSLGNVQGQILPMSQLQQSDIPNYWAYAQNFVLADMMFSSLPSGTFPNHLYAVANDSDGTFTTPNTTSKGDWGCDAPKTVTVEQENVKGVVNAVYPCFSYKTLADELQAAGISWKYYAPPKGVNGYSYSTLNSFTQFRNTTLWTTNVVDYDSFASDVAAGTLPAVSWLSPGRIQSEHPPQDFCPGEDWTVTQINAIMANPTLWNSTAIFITWDDFGGFYDHIVPPARDKFPLGPRIPLLIISPYVKSGYISHTQYEFASVLRFIEERFGLAPLGDRDKTANDTSDSFNFSQAPLSPLILTPRTCSLAPTSTVNVGYQTVGTSSQVYPVEFTNPSSTQTITMTSITTTGDFKAASLCGPKVTTLNNCSINITFTPTAAGTRTGTMVITDSDPSSPQTVTLTGQGTELSQSASKLNFTGTPIGSTSAPKVVTLQNLGTSPITISQVQATGAYAETDKCVGSLLGGASCTVSVFFKPLMSGSSFGAVYITTDGPGSPQVINLTGTSSALSFNPPQLTFAAQSIGTTSEPQTITIKNNTATAVVMGTIAIQGPFAQTNTCSPNILGNGTCTITVTYTPTASGAQTGTVKTLAADFLSPFTSKLTGTGQQ